GEQARVPLRFELPRGLATGSYEIHLTARFDTGEPQEDRFVVNVLSPIELTTATRPLTPPLSPGGGEGARGPGETEPRLAKIALFDPKGETAKLLETIGVRAQQIPANADLSSYEVLVVGKSA